MRRGRGTITSVQGRRFYRCREANIVMLILNSVVQFQSNVLFSVMISAFLLSLQAVVWNSVAFGPLQRSLGPA